MIKICGHRVLVKLEKIEDVDPVYASAVRAGIAIAETDDHRRREAGLDRGTVIDIGPTAWQDFNSDPWCKVGDFVAFAKYAGKVIEHPEDPEQRYIVLNDEDIVAILKEGK